MMAVASTLLRLGDVQRDLYLFDTFAGMPVPGEKDVDSSEEKAEITWKKLSRKDHNQWCYCPLEKVQANMARVGYNSAKFHFVKGLVEETIPDLAPQEISLLRIDTDWYSSVKHLLVHLFPKISPGGVIIIDDYGHWEGARQATDEYLKEQKIRLLLNRLDYTGRIGVKL